MKMFEGRASIKGGGRSMWVGLTQSKKNNEWRAYRAKERGDEARERGLE